LLFIEIDKFKRLNALASGDRRDFPPSSDMELLSRLTKRFCRLARPARGDIRD